MRGRHPHRLCVEVSAPLLRRRDRVSADHSFHAAVFTGWLGLFIAQTTLVSRGRTDLHRKLGVAGVVFAALMLIVGVQASLTIARLGHRGIPGVESPDPAGFLLVNLNAIIGFSLLVAAGWVFRRRPQTHKRIMLLAMVSLMPPGIARLPQAISPRSP